jgi:transcriptional regulator with XRE-family HTH domain
MAEPTTLGSWLRRERERRGITLSQIADQTKVSVSFLEGLESDDLSRWPGGIFRRSFARAYATAIGIDCDLVLRRIEEEHPEPGAEPPVSPVAVPDAQPARREQGTAALTQIQFAANALRVRAALLDVLVALAIGLGFAAAGSRLLWPVLLIAAYHAVGLIVAGTSPMAALLAEQPLPVVKAPAPAKIAEAPEPVRRAETHVRRVHRGRRSGGREQAAHRS